MKSNKYLIIILFLFFKYSTQAQTKISGIVLDSLTHQPISDLSVLDVLSNKGTLTNENGEFVISIKSLPIKILFSHVSYKKVIKTIISENLGEVYLPLAIINLPEAKTENPALTLLTSAINKAMSDTANKYPCHAFYQKISKEGNNNTNIHEIFFDGIWSQFGITKWKPTNARYAVKENTTFKFQNLTSAIFCNSGLISRSIIKPNSVKLVEKDFSFKIAKYLNFDTSEEIAEVICTPKLKNNYYFEGSVYIKTKNNNILKIVGEIHSPKPKPKRLKDAYESVSANFKETNLGYCQLDNLTYNRYVTLSGIIDEKIAETGKLFVYEYDNTIETKEMTSAFIQSDLELIKNTAYKAHFWENNEIIKRSNLGKSLIKSFENSKGFESNFINKK